MKGNKNVENIDLILYEVHKPIDKVKFIISNIYYYIRGYYNERFLKSSNDFHKYLNKFKTIFKKKQISNSFSFELFNKSYNNNSNTNNNPKEKSTNEEIYYDSLYKRLINILIEQNISINDKEKTLIDSFISLRNCFIFLEYLYIFINQNSDKINHYIIKIDISLLLNIPLRASKRLINSEEYFYLNLIELKGIFSEINYTPSAFLINFDYAIYDKYSINIFELKTDKLRALKTQLSALMATLGKLYDNKVALLNDDLYLKSRDLPNIFTNLDELIQKYIYDVMKCKNKNLKKILDEINENEIIPEYNYLYLIALNSFNHLIGEDKENLHIKQNEISFKDKESDEKKINEVKTILKEEKIINNDKLRINDEKIIKGNQLFNDKFKQEKEKIIKMEELKVKIKNVIEKDISKLEDEENNKDKDIYQQFIKRTFTFDKVFNLAQDNIYNILLFLEIYKKKIGIISGI